MTFLEIYNNIAGLVYGDVTAAPPPAHEIAFIRNLVLSRHRDCQLGYNYWFQKVITTFPIVSGTDTYTWPADFKELISIDIDAELTYSATGFLYDEAPTENSNVDFEYWSITSLTTWIDAYEDNVSIYLAWYLIYQVTGDMFLKRGEKSDAQAYYALAAEARLNAEREDFHRRQSMGVIF